MKGTIRRSVERMTGYTPGEQPTDPAMIKLNTNENPYPPSPRVAEALHAFDPVRLRLYPDPVSRRLRECIASLHGVDVAQVFVGNGSDEVLALCARAFVERTGTIGWFEPSYSLYPVLARIEDVAVRPVELGPDFEWRMPADYTADLFYLTCPNAPTGLAYPAEEIEAFCRRFPGVVLIDEAYADFADRNCLDLVRLLPNVLVARTVSKSYSLAGLRVGMLTGPERLISAIFKIKDSYNLDRLAQELAFAALSDPDHMRGNVRRIVATRERISSALTQRGCRVFPSQTNFVWYRPPASVPASAMFEALRERKILVRYFPGPRTGEYLRATVGTDADMDRLVRATSEILA